MSAIPLQPKPAPEAAVLPHEGAAREKLSADIDALAPALYRADDTAQLSALLKVIARARALGAEGFDILKEFASKLREMRAFDDLYILTSKMKASGLADDDVTRWEIQALIELGVFETAIDLIQPLLAKGPKDRIGRDGYGALGRIYKQLYLDAVDPSTKTRVEPATLAFYVQRSFNAYMHVWEAERSEETAYYGVNAVAIAFRAARDKVEGDSGAMKLAQDVFNVVSKPADRDGWSWATQGEALVALGRFEEAAAAYGKFAFAPKVSFFQLGAALRQLEEVWQIEGEDEVRGLPVRLLKAATIAKLGNAERTDERDREATIRKAPAADKTAVAPGLQSSSARRPMLDPNQVNMSVKEAGLLRNDMNPPGAVRGAPLTGLQQVFEDNAPLGLPVLLNSLERAKSVCRIHTIRAGADEGIGSGFAVIGKLLNDKWGDKPVIVTNNHVISSRPNNLSQRMELCHAVFVSPDGKTQHRVEFSGTLWESEIDAHDITVLRPKDDKLPDGVQPLTTLPRTGLPPRALDDNGIGRVYIIGYPAAGQLAFSIADNIFLDHDAPEGCDVTATADGQRRVSGVTPEPVHLHYKAPTLGGSSGSPVFDFNDYALLGVHHRGLPNMERLKGREGAYAANEGIWIESVRAAIAESIGAGDGQESAASDMLGRWRSIAAAAPLVAASAPIVAAAISGAMATVPSTPAQTGKPRLIPGSFGLSSPGKSSVADQVIHLPGKASAAEVKSAGMETIIGMDNRTRIFDTAMSPWRMICAIRGYWGTRLAVGTGCFIGPNTILTAGHVVFPRDKRSLPDDMEIIPALNGAEHTYGVLKAASVSVHPRWQTNGEIQRDVAVIHLKEPIGNKLGWFGVSSQTPDELQSVWAHVSGYPGEKMDTVQAKPGERESAPVQAAQLWHHAAPIIAVQNDRIFYAADTTPGQSGAPIYVSEPAGTSITPVVVGVHAYGAASTPTAVGGANSGAWIGPDLFDIISLWRAESQRILENADKIA